MAFLMGLGLSLLLTAIAVISGLFVLGGAFLKYVVVEGRTGIFDVQAIGTIIMFFGALGLVPFLLVLAAAAVRRRREKRTDLS